jgi:hypothetical protein
MDDQCLIHSKDKNFLYSSVQTDTWVHPASYPMGTGGSFRRVKQPGNGDDHSLPSNAKVKNEAANFVFVQLTELEIGDVSRKLRLRCCCQFPWRALALSVRLLIWKPVACLKSVTFLGNFGCQFPWCAHVVASQ